MEEENWEKGKNALVRFEKSTSNHPLQESRETKRGDETELTSTTKSQVNRGTPLLVTTEGRQCRQLCLLPVTCINLVERETETNKTGRRKDER